MRVNCQKHCRTLYALATHAGWRYSYSHPQLMKLKGALNEQAREERSTAAD